jgi:hypothetical protein
MPPLDDAYAVQPELATCSLVEDTFTIEPEPWPAITRAAS